MLSVRLQNLCPFRPTGRVREIDELKGWAMLLVILYHAGGVLGWNNWLHGEVGVDIFLIVSGFTLARGSRYLPWRQFLRRRLLRIFPTYWLALALFTVLHWHYFGARYSTLNLITHVLGLHGFALAYGSYFSAINDSFWFISLILALYLVFLGVRHRLEDVSWITGIGLLLTAVALWSYLEANHDGGLSQLAMRIPSFFIGLVAAQLSGPQPSEFKASPVLAFGAVVMTYIGFTRSLVPFYAFAGCALVVAFFAIRQVFLRHPDGRFFLSALALMGVYSYEIFLFHQPLIRDYNRLVQSRVFGLDDPSRFQLMLGIVVGLLLTFAISFVVHHATARLFSSRQASVALPPP